MPVVLLEKGQHLPHIIVFLRADCETFEAIVIVILDNFVGLCRVAQIIFVENYYFIFLIFLDYQVKLRVTAAVWNPCISNLYEDVYLLAVLLDQAQGLLHVPWEPVYMIFQRIDHLHFEMHLCLWWKFNNNSDQSMNTPKYNTILNRNAVSPLRSAPKGKYYSAQEVIKILKTTYQPKIQFLMQQLQERQQIIARLNNKLNQNDEKLLQQSSIIESHLKRHKDSSQIHSYVVSTINQLINDKTKQIWETVMSQLRQVIKKIQGEMDYKRIEAIIQQEMEKVKASVDQFIDTHKKKSNSYWQKIKQALNKINSKIVSAQKGITDIYSKLQGFQQQRIRDREMINQLQNSKSVVKNLIQLRKSVENIYGNYQTILTLQKGLKQKIEDQHGDSLWHEPQFLKATSKLVMPHEEIIALEYSKEQGYNDRFMENEWRPYENITQPMVSPIKADDNNRSASDILGLHKTTPLKPGAETSEIFSLNTSNNQMNSKIHNNTLLLNFSLQTRKQMSQGVKQRLLQLIELKNLPKPLQVRFDQQINYLKSTQGNYLFDMKGNMFKISKAELQKLESEGIVMRTKSKKISLSNSKVKRTNC